MTPRNLVTAAFVCLVALPGMVSVFTGCESTPEAPEFNNPFDPDSDTGGDPLQLTATLTDSSITVTWTQPQGMGLTLYEVLHSFNSFSDFLLVGEVDHVEGTTFGSFTYLDPEPTRAHYFKVRAFAGDRFSLISEQVPALKVTPPRVVFGDGSGDTPTRYIDLRVTVSRGDSLRIADNPGFAGQTVVAAGASGVPVSVPWDLGAVGADDSTVTVYVLAEPADGLRDTAIVDVTTRFAPAFGVVGDPPTLASHIIDLYVPLEGVEMMRFANSPATLAVMPWRTPADTLRSYNITSSANPQTVYGEFQGDLGYNTVTTLEVVPDLLTDATFRLDLPADHISEASTVIGLCDARATLMRFSESTDFSEMAWQDYNDAAVIPLSPGGGRKVIHAQFRNTWAESAILTDYVIHVSQALEVTILTPGEEAVILAGTTLQVQGTSTAASGTAPVDSVKFDGGDGFAAVDGTDNWQTLWTAPRFTADTPVVLRARAWADGDSVTTVRTVTVSQPLVRITLPTEGANVTGGTNIDVKGTATPATGGAAIDSVVVDLAGTRVLAEGTDSWALTWSPGAVTENTPAVLIATAFADGQTAADTTAVTVVPDASP